MKLSLILAAIAVSAQAGRRFNPKRTPKDMKGDFRVRWFMNDDGEQEGTGAIGDGSDVLDGDVAAREICLRESRLFDEYCH